MILLQLDERKKIHRDMMYGIAKDSCKAQNMINERLIRSCHMDRERINLEGMKFDLGQQERKEAAGYFNDTCQLNSELREALNPVPGRGSKEHAYFRNGGFTMITKQDVKKLKQDAIQFALMMDDHEIEQVIVDFVEVKNMRQRSRSGK